MKTCKSRLKRCKSNWMPLLRAPTKMLGNSRPQANVNGVSPLKMRSRRSQRGTLNLVAGRHLACPKSRQRTWRPKVTTSIYRGLSPLANPNGVSPVVTSAKQTHVQFGSENRATSRARGNQNCPQCNAVNSRKQLVREPWCAFCRNLCRLGCLCFKMCHDMSQTQGCLSIL